MSIDDEKEAVAIAERIIREAQGAKFIKIPVWEMFANDIAFFNRFMPSPIKTDVNNYLDHILQKDSMRYTIPKGTILYRARRIKKEDIKRDANGDYIGYSERESGMPPYRLAPYGRVGTSGIPVFYSATDRKTSCMELRPSKDEFLSVGEYEVRDDLLLADFSLEQVDAYDNSFEGKLFLKEMFTSFSTPVTSELIDYLPSEYISEFIRRKHKELDGIRYSSLHNIGGYNIALFNQSQCKYMKSHVVGCQSVDCVFADLNDQQWWLLRG